MILQIALDTPLRRVFDYRLPTELGSDSPGVPRLGVRVRVPFGRRQLIGVLLSGIAAESSIADSEAEGGNRHSGRAPHRRSSHLRPAALGGRLLPPSLGRGVRRRIAGQPACGSAGNAEHRMVVPESGPGEKNCHPPARGVLPSSGPCWHGLSERGRATTDDVRKAFKPVHLRAAAARGLGSPPWRPRPKLRRSSRVPATWISPQRRLIASPPCSRPCRALPRTCFTASPAAV